jgi:hypothetical protein
MLNDLPKEDPPAAYCCHELSNIDHDRGEYKLDLTWFQKTMQIFERTEDDLCIATTLINIGWLYQSKSESVRAFESFNKVLTIFQ